MYICEAVVILHFTQLDPLNPKPITGDLSGAPPQPPSYWWLRLPSQTASRLPLVLLR